MSDRDSNHTVVTDDDTPPPPSVVRTLSRILNTEVEEDRVIPRKKKGDGTHMTTRAKTPKILLFKGLMKTKSCETSVEMVQMMVPLISK